MTLAVATEKIANFRPRHPGLTGLFECGGDHIFSLTGNNVAEDVARRRLAVIPDSQGGIEVLNAYLVAAV